MIRFEVLGSLAVRRVGVEIPIAAPKQRALLALLLINANRAVPAEHLMYELWGETPPKTARGTLQSLVSRLRSLLVADGSETPLRSRHGGYELVIDDGSYLDMLAFDRAVGRLDAISSADRAERAAAIHDALGLWRGKAFADVPITPGLSVEATRLEESRLTLEEERIGLQLESGQYAEVVPKARMLLAEHPLRERLWEQLILALHHLGRPSEALKAYLEARGSLAAELNIEPGRELERLHQIIQRRDVRDPAPAPAGGAAWSSQLPPDIADFTGRAKETGSARAWLGSGTTQQAVAIVAVSGMAGIGKTAFALHTAHGMRDRFEDGQLYVDLRGAGSDPLDPGEVLLRFLRSAGVSGTDVPTSLGERAAMYRSSIAGRRVLVVLDNAADELQVEPLLPGSPTCAVIVTSRRRLSGLAGAHHVALDAFSEDEALGLLRAVVGPERVAPERTIALRLADLCGRHPLSLRICASRLAARPQWTLATLTTKLAGNRLKLNELDDGSMNVRASFDLSYEALEPSAQRLFCLLGLLRMPDFAAWSAAPLLGVSVAEAEEQLELLVECRLLEAAWHHGTGRPRYRFHDLIRWYSVELAEQLISATERIELIERVLGTWLALADRAHEAAYRGNFLLTHGTAARMPLDPEYTKALLADPWSWWESERAGLVSMIVQAAEEGLDEGCWDLTATATTLFGTCGYLEDWELTHETALAVTRRRAARRGEAVILSHMGGLRIYQGRHEDAVEMFDQAVEMLGELGETRALALAFVGLGIARRGQSNLPAALRHFHQGHDLLTGRNDSLAEAHVLLQMAQTYLTLGEHERAEKYLSESRCLARGSGSPVEGYACHRLGKVYLARGDDAAAVAAFSVAIDRVAPIGDVRTQISILKGLARGHIGLGDRAQAESCLLRAGAITQNLKDTTGKARTLDQIGNLLREIGADDHAFEFLAMAAHVYRRNGAGRRRADSPGLLAGRP